jgi:hypothetical protein
MRLTATCDGQPVTGTYVTAGYVWLDDMAPFGEWDHDRAVAFEMLVDPQPDTTDGATRGAFLDAVREAYGDDGMYASRWCDRWAVSRGNDNIAVTAATEWDALCAAWAARPGGGGA